MVTNSALAIVTLLCVGLAGRGDWLTDATVFVIDCGPRDAAYFRGASENVGAGEAPWAPLDHSTRSTGWTSATEQHIEYQVPEGAVAPGPYEIRAWVCVQQQLKLSLSLVVDGETLAGPEMLDNTEGKGYPPFCVKARRALTGQALTVRLAADRVADGDRIRAVRVEFVSLDRLTQDGNVARAAEVAVSSQLTPEYPVDAINDGLCTYQGTTRGRSWASRETAEEHWVEFALAKAETIGRIVIWWPRYPTVYNAAREILVQTPADGGWATVGRIDTRIPMPRSEACFEPFETDRVRLVMPAGMGALHRPNILWVNEIGLWRQGTPVAQPPTGASVVSWTRAGKPDWPEKLEGGEAIGEGLVLLAESASLGPPTLEDVVPASARDQLDWWWDGAPLGVAGATGGKVHRLIFAPKAANALPLQAVALRIPGKCELVRWDDHRALPPPYETVPPMTDAELFAALDLSREGLSHVAKAVEQGDMAAAKAAFAEYVKRRKYPPPPRVSDATLVRPDDEPPDREAERFLNHEWYFYRHREWRPLGETVNWYLPDGDGSDRHYIARLDLAGYIIDRWEREGGDRWLRGYLDIMRQFYANARPPADPPVFPSSHLPWCGLCSAIRIRNILEDYFRIADSPLLSTEDHVRIYKMALEHARFLTECDGGGFFAGNHQMGHLVALEIITATFPEFRETADWRGYLQPLLREHLKRDTFADGGSVDTATGYGIWVATSLFTDAYLYAADAGVDVGPEWRERLERMYEWCLKIGAPDGGYLAVGDANFRIDSDENRSGASAVGYRGALLFGQPDFLWFASRPGAYQLPEARRERIARELFGDGFRDGMKRLTGITPVEPAFRSVNLPDTGWTIMRSDWSPEAVYMLVNHHRGGHTHKTQNDFNIIAYGRPFIADPGIPHTYTTDRWQGWYVKTIAHNTVLVDDEDMQPGPGDPGRFFTSPPVDFLRVTHDRYAAIGIAGHQRNVLFIKDDLFLIDDYLQGAGSHDFSWLAHFQPMALAVDAGQGTVMTDGGGPGLTLAASDPGSLQFEQHTGWMNVPTKQVCEEVEDAPWIALTKTTEAPTGYGVAIAVGQEGPPEARIEALPVDGGLEVGGAYHVEWPGGTCDAAFCHGEPSHRRYGPIATDGLAAGILRRADGSRVLFAIDGTAVAAEDLEVRRGQESGCTVAAFAGAELDAWLDGDAVPLRVKAPGLEAAHVNGEPATVERDGEWWVVGGGR